MKIPLTSLILPLTMVVGVAGCTTWGRRDLGRLEAGTAKTLQFWVDGEDLTLHGLGFFDDSIVGVPHWQSTQCSSCRVTLQREAIDSVRVRVHSIARSKGAVIGGTLSAFFATFLTLGLCEDSNTGRCLIKNLSGIGLTAALGAFVGWAFGSSVE